MKKLFLLLFLSVTLFGVSAQELCAFDTNQAKLEKQNPAIKQARLEAEAKLLRTDIQKFLRENGHGSLDGKSPETIYEIPVVVHMMNDGTAPLRTNAEIIKWIDDCNKFYATTYGGDWYTVAQGNVVIPFRLVLAKRSPSCTATTGINQVNVTAVYPNYSVRGVNSGNTNGVSTDQLRALSRWDPETYYNIYLVNTFDSVPVSEPAGLQGYAGFPSNPDFAFDAFMKASVVINTTDPTTLPHEFGHSLGLYHPFEDGSKVACPVSTSGGCAVDNDKVCDTPSTKNLLGVAPLPLNGSANPCDAAGWNNVQYNVMNYTSSSRLFTQGQKTRGLAMFLQNRMILTTSLGGTAPSTTTAPVPASCAPNVTNSATGNFNYGPTSVKLGTINNASEGSNSSNANKTYYDYSALTCRNTRYATNLDSNQPAQTITVSSITNSNTFNIYIDYNNDGAFNETSEKVVSELVVNPNSTNSANFSIPSTGVTYNTPLRMRVVAGDQSHNSCDQNIASGQVEDYAVTITNSVLSTADDSVKNREITLYPNPSKDGEFSIKLNDSLKGDIQVAIVDMSGRIVYQTSGKINRNKLSINAKLIKGNYIVRVNSGTITISEKLIVN